MTTDPERARFVEWFRGLWFDGKIGYANAAADAIERAVRHLNREVDEPYPVRLSGGDIDWESNWPIPWRAAMQEDEG